VTKLKNLVDIERSNFANDSSIPE